MADALAMPVHWYYDREVIGKLISPACYIGESFPAGLYLTWKYRNDFSGGIIANARVGGDNCHRGSVVWSLLAARNGIPEKWLSGKSLDGYLHLREHPGQSQV